MKISKKGFRTLAVAVLSFSLIASGTAAFGLPPGLGGSTGGQHGGGGSGGGMTNPTPPGGNKGGGNKGGGSKNRGGGNSQAPAPSGFVRNVVSTSWSSSTAISWGCAATSGAHNGQGVIGATKTTSYRVRGAFSGPLIGDKLSERLSCHYPPAWSETTVTCIRTSTAHIDRVYPARNRVQSVTQNTAYASNPTLSNCLNSEQWITVNAVPNLYGHWSATGSTTGDRCAWRVYRTADPRTGAVPGDELRGCSRVILNPFTAKGTLTCRGWTNGVHLTGYTFTEDDCKNIPGNNDLVCHVGGAPTVNWNGQTWTGTSVEVLRNGGNVQMKWATPSITGSGLQRVISTRTRVAVADAPWSNSHTVANNWFGLQKTGNKNNALVDKNGTKWENELRTDWTGQWYQPTSSATKITPQYGFTADFQKTTVRITGVHTNGTWRTATTTTTVRSDASCQAPTLNVTSLRVVNSVG